LANRILEVIMSKSREAIDKEKNQNASQQNVTQPTSPSSNLSNTESRYRAGRESSSDFPRRSRSQRYRSDNDWQSVDRTEYSNRYNRGASAGRSRFDQADRYDQPARYENLQRRNEDSGDFYSRSIRERMRTDEYDRTRRGEHFNRAERDNRNYQQHRPSASRYEPRESFRSDYDSERYEQETPYRNESRFNRESYRPVDRYPAESGYTAYDTDFGDSRRDWYGREVQGQTYQVACRDIMTRDVTTCTPETNLRQVAEKMDDENVGSIPVVENGRLIGLVTDRDIVCRVLANGQDSRAATAREAMTESIVTCHPDESVVEAIHKMGEFQVRRIPICDSNGNLRGIISTSDIALEAERNLDLAQALEQISQPKKYWQNNR
jgi:CBS domain-containing protein